MQFLYSDEFEREFKKLSKKYKTLKEDFEIAKKAIKVDPKGNGTKHWNILKEDKEKELYILKMRLMCRTTLGANFRLIYFYNGKNVEVLFIEIYFKGQKVNEDKKRVSEYWDSLQK